MDTIEITCAVVGGLRLDFPSEKQTAALAYAWDDDANHQISFLSASDFRAARREGEYASMIASADLVLPVSPSLAVLASGRSEPTADGGVRTRHIPIGARRREYLTYFGPPEADQELFHAYAPLKTLSIFLSALEGRGGSAFLLGGTSRTLQRAEQHLKSTFPGLRIVGRETGDYRAEDEPAIMRALQKSTPDIVVAGSLVKDAELWIPRHMRYTKSGIFFYEPFIMETLAGRA